MVTRDPADFHEFLTKFTGQHEIKSSSIGIDFDLGDGSHAEVLSPSAFRAFYGEVTDTDPRCFMAWRVAVADLKATRALLSSNGVAFSEIAGRIVVPAATACGAVLAFEAG
jgi:hypothetical protein